MKIAEVIERYAISSVFGCFFGGYATKKHPKIS